MDYQKKLTKIGSREDATLASILKDPKDIFGLPRKQKKESINSKLLEKQKDETYGGSRAEHIRRTATPNTQALKTPSPQEQITKYKFLNQLSNERQGEKQVTIEAADYSIPLNQRRRSSILDQETQIKIDQMKEVFRQYEDDDHEDSGYDVSSPEASAIDKGLYRNHTFSSSRTKIQTQLQQSHFRMLQQKRLNRLKWKEKGIRIQNGADDDESEQTPQDKVKGRNESPSFLRRMNSQIFNDNFVFSQVNAKQNWKKVKQRVIQHLKMKRMVDFLSVYKNDERQDSDEELLTRCQRLMIHPQNKKLRYWNYFLSIITLIDILYIINIMFHLPQDEYHEINIFDAAIAVFIVDFVVQFFKMGYKDESVTAQSKQVLIDYLKTTRRVIIDLLALFPFQLFAPDFTFLKFMRIFRFSQAVSYFLDLVEQVLQFVFNFKKRTMKNISSLLKLFIVLGFVCHFLACCWLYIGKLGVEMMSGWMVRLYKLGTLDSDYQSQYIASIYYIFATLSTVGYGDIVGTDAYEYAFQIVVQIIGIGFFAYVMGNLHNILASFSFHDPTTFQIFHKFVVSVQKDEGLDQWMIQLDRAYKEKNLDQELFSQTQTFFNSYSSKSLNTIKSVHFFKQLKPRLQNQLLDTLFAEFYEQFDFVFKGTEESFRRDVFKHLKFKMFQKNIKKKSKQNVFVEYRPSIFMKGDMPSHVYFILKGNVYFTNESGAYTYFQLSAGSYFADSNILFNYPSSYSAFYDEDEGPLQVLRIKRAKFHKICDEFPSSRMVLERRAQDRRHKFRKYKIKSLVKVMKSLVKMYYTNKQSPLIQKSFVNRQRQVVEIYKALLSHFYHMAENYEIMREAYNEKQHRERFEDYKDRADENAAISMNKKQSISPEPMSRNGGQEMQQLDFASQLFGSFKGRNSLTLSRSTVRPSSKSVNPIYQSSEPIPIAGQDMKKFMSKRMTQLLEESVTQQLEDIQEYNQVNLGNNQFKGGDYYTMGMINEESKSRSSEDENQEEEIEQVEEFRDDQHINSDPTHDNRKFSVLTITAIGGVKVPQMGNNSGSTAMLNFSTARDSQFKMQAQQQINSHQQLQIVRDPNPLSSFKYKNKVQEQTKVMSSPKSLSSNKTLLNKLKQQRQRTQRDSQDTQNNNLSLKQQPLKQITDVYNFSEHQILMTSSRRDTEGQLLTEREQEEEKQEFKRFMDDDIHLTQSISISHEEEEEDEGYQGNIKINLIDAEGSMTNQEPAKQQHKMRILYSDSPNFEKYPPFSNQDIINQNQVQTLPLISETPNSYVEGGSLTPLRPNISTVLEEDSMIGISTPSVKNHAPVLLLKSEHESQIQIGFYEVAGSTGGPLKDQNSSSQKKKMSRQIPNSEGSRRKQEANLIIQKAPKEKMSLPIIESLEIIQSNEQTMPLTIREEDPILDLKYNENDIGKVQKLHNSFIQPSNRNNQSHLKPSANTTKGKLSKKSSQELKYIMQEQELYQKLKSQKLPFDVYKNEIVCEYLYNSEEDYPESKAKDNNSHHLDDQFKVVINGGQGNNNSQVSIPNQKQGEEKVADGIDDYHFIYPENQKVCLNFDSYCQGLTEEFEKAKEEQMRVQTNMQEKLYLLRLQTRPTSQQFNLQIIEPAQNQQSYHYPILENQSIRR